MMFQFDSYLHRQRALIEAALEEHLPKAETRPAVLHEAMRYSVFSGGKRLRPMLCLAACEAVGGETQDALVPACAIELLHTYTLIHDDLPAMDDDEVRRGKLTSHVKFGEANAILAGDALLTLTFEWLADYPVLTKELAAAAGSEGVIAGQVEDLQAEGSAPDEAKLQYIHQNKTAKLFRASLRIGAIVGKATERQLAAVTKYGECIGQAFQIIDDLADEKQDEQMTAVDVWGRAGTSARAKDLLQAGEQALHEFGAEAEALRAVVALIGQPVY